MMTHDEYRRHLDKLGVTITGARHLFGVSERTARRIASGEISPVPQTVELLVRIMVKHDLTPEDVLKLARVKPPPGGFGDQRYTEE